MSEHHDFLVRATFAKRRVSGRQHGRSPTWVYWVVVFGSDADRNRFAAQWGRMVWDNVALARGW